MTISFVKPSLQSLDSIQADVLVVGLYTNERPPMGLTGLLDWRLCGYVSDLLVEDKISTAVGEATLFPSYGRLTFPGFALLVLVIPTNSHLAWPRKCRHASLRPSTNYE